MYLKSVGGNGHRASHVVSLRGPALHFLSLPVGEQGERDVVSDERQKRHKYTSRLTLIWHPPQNRVCAFEYRCVAWIYAVSPFPCPFSDCWGILFIVLFLCLGVHLHVCMVLYTLIWVSLHFWHPWQSEAPSPAQVSPLDKEHADSMATTLLHCPTDNTNDDSCGLCVVLTHQHCQWWKK